MPESPHKSDVVEKSWRKLHLSQAAHRAVISSLKISFLFLLLFVDMSYAVFSGLFSVVHPLIWFIELSIVVLLVIQIIGNGLVLGKYLWANLFGRVVNITEDQRRLMAIPVNDKSFRTPPRDWSWYSSKEDSGFPPGYAAYDQSFSTLHRNQSNQSWFSRTEDYSATPAYGWHGKGYPSLSHERSWFSPADDYSTPPGYKKTSRTPPNDWPWSSPAEKYGTPPGYMAEDTSPYSPTDSLGSRSSWAAQYEGTPRNSSYSSTPLHSMSLLSPYSSPAHQRSFNSSFNSSLDRSLNRSGMSRSSTRRYEGDRSSIRSRRSASVPVNTRSSRHARITDVETLNKYICQEEEKELNRSQVSPENLSSGNMSFWTYGSNPADFLHILRRFAYQLAPTWSVAPTLASSSDQIDSRGVGEAWVKYRVSEDELYKWTENLRKWLSFTIVSRLYAEIEEVNVTLQKIGCEDTQIGEVGVSTLKQLALTKGNFVPTLNSIVPYLDLSANQEYLYKRIKDLSTGSISAFTWDKGGNYGKPWGTHLPTDASLVMHLFCCYLDSRLPAEPKYPDGKSFTAQHFTKTPDIPGSQPQAYTLGRPSADRILQGFSLFKTQEEPDAEKKDNLIIYQSNINPPHFQVMIGSHVYNLSQGRNNMFQAVLLFLYHIKVKENGMLGRINLGMSGLNMLWIFDEENLFQQENEAGLVRNPQANPWLARESLSS